MTGLLRWKPPEFFFEKPTVDEAYLNDTAVPLGLFPANVTLGKRQASCDSTYAIITDTTQRFVDWDVQMTPVVFSFGRPTPQHGDDSRQMSQRLALGLVLCIGGPSKVCLYRQLLPSVELKRGLCFDQGSTLLSSGVDTPILRTHQF